MFHRKEQIKEDHETFEMWRLAICETKSCLTTYQIKEKGQNYKLFYQER